MSAWALASLDYVPRPDLVQELYAAAAARADAFQPQGLCMLLWAAANSGRRPPARALQVTRAMRCLDTMPPGLYPYPLH